MTGPAVIDAPAPAAATAPAPIAAPQPVTPLAPVANAAPVARETLEQALARANAEGQAPHHSETQLRNPDGTFVDPAAAPQTDAEPYAPDPAAPPTATLVYPGEDARGEAELPLTIEGTPEEIAAFEERHQRLLNGSMRRKEFEASMAHVEQRQQAAEQIELRAQLDPGGFMLDYVPPDAMRSVVLSLLSDDGFLATISDELETMGDPAQRRRVAAEAKLALRDYSEQAQGRIEQTRANRILTGNINLALQAVAPAHLSQAQQTQWIDDTNLFLAHLIQSGQLDKRSLSPHALPVVLRARFEGVGISAVEAAQKIAVALTQGTVPSRTGAPPAAAPAAGNAPRPAPAAPAPQTGAPLAPRPPAPTAEALRERHATRAAAAQTGGPGAGSPISSGIQPPAAGPNQLAQVFKQLKRAG